MTSDRTESTKASDNLAIQTFNLTRIFNGLVAVDSEVPFFLPLTRLWQATPQL